MESTGEKPGFLGEYEHTLDDKGRLAIPAKFRPALSEGLVITRGLDQCLWIMSVGEWQVMAEKLSQLSLMHADNRRLHRLVFGGATDTFTDRLGRVLIPPFLRDYAELRDATALVGLQTRIEVWSQANWRRERALDDAVSSQLAEQVFALGSL